jgi:hypothetical protein
MASLGRPVMTALSPLGVDPREIEPYTRLYDIVVLPEELLPLAYNTFVVGVVPHNVPVETCEISDFFWFKVRSVS